MRTKKAILNTFASFILQIVTFIIGLIIPVLIIDTYGSSLNGLRASIAQFIGYLYIIEMGLGGALTFALYQPIVENNILKINSILSAAKKSYYETGVYFSVLVVSMMIIYPLFVVSDDINRYEVMLLILALGVPNVINLFTISKYNVLITASQYNYVISFTRIIYLCINTVIILVLVKLNLNISLVYLFSTVASLFQMLIIKLYTKSKYKYIDLNVKPDNSAISKRYDVLLHQISAMVVFGSPVILLTLICTLEDVSVYSIYSMIFWGINMIVGVFNSGFTAGFGQIIAQKDHIKLKKTYSQYEFAFYNIITFVYSCVLILGIPFIEIYTKNITDVNYVDPLILYLFIIIGILNNWKLPQSTIINAAGHYKETRNRAILEAVITLVASTILVIYFGLIGALIGSIIGLVYRSIDLFYIKRITDIGFKNTFIRILRIFVIGGFAVAPFLIWIPLNPHNLMEWFLAAIIVSIWVGVVVLVFGFVFERNTMKVTITKLYRGITSIIERDKRGNSGN
ncbi:hypothetical protein BK120_15810 [Paenibacillus sp. FSL A5-0031]|uniref:lipopolysaccharide biosynthesis protein n=1 Tax=Paenibacillus sp. FSL A5-0031 TaxID=1920420 RepID=UPI00096D0305|nr:polysaccharide biosynthesis C-terminal domain-containing protein [Paenibacillus sp. FSL A5-0031]OME82136.1 hypothetical protein BK120_15810 [Paenibacillus sp. FSL A5-0031]